MPTSSLLMDILGITVGFAGIMLLLSLIVTAVVQFVQSLLGMRPRNLAHGVSGLLETVLGQGPAAQTAVARAQGKDKPEVGASTSVDVRQKVSKALNAARFAPDRDVAKPLQAVFNPVNPLMSWVEPDELLMRLEESGTPLDTQQKEKLKALYDRMEMYLSKRFSLQIRYVTIAMAFLVAGAFQVSAPHLLQELSTNPQARERAVAVSERLLEKYKDADSLPGLGKAVPEQALEKLAAKFPDLAPKLEEASGSPSRAESIREVELVLEGVPKKAEVLKAYGEILDELSAAGARDARERLKEHSGELALLNIVPFGGGFRFYEDPVKLLGLVVTAILLTLGAPFWYEMLRNMANLEDALKKKPEAPEKRV